jgi:DNA-binding SARP family transcriptional activator
MRFAVLGSLQVTADDGAEPGTVSATRLRVLLAVLLWRANQPVPADELAELVWDGAPPAGAPEAVRALVMRLRRRLDPQAAARIVTRAPGYAIEISGDELDASQFETLTRQAGAAVRAGQWEQAARTAAKALELWRGAPLADIPSQLLWNQWVPHLDLLHVQALDWRIEGDLHDGRHEQIVPELRDLTARHPLREHFHTQLMLALYRCGRQAEALAAYQHARDVLVTELGIEPGPALRDLHQRILSADPALAVTGPARPAAAGPGPGTPRELPAAVPGFTGRPAELAALTGLLDQPGERTGATAVICAIGGTAGVGKTALAVHWAHQAAGQFPDGQLYVNLRGYDPGPPMPPADALAGFLRSLGVPGQDIPPEQDQRAARYRSLLADKRMLIVLDNARDEQQVRPLLAGGPGCLVIVTSRSQLPGLAAAEGAHMLMLNVLSPAEARQMLSARLGDRAAAEQDTVDEIARLCARLPLALAIAAAHAAARPRLALADLAEMLGDERKRLDALDSGDPAMNVRAVFSWSVRWLSSEAAQMFCLLGLHPGPDFTVSAAASLAAIAPSAAARALRELEAQNLITERLPGRYSLHDLLRTYASERAGGIDEEARRAAVGRILDHYLHTARTAALLLNPAREQVSSGPPASGVTPEILVDRRRALAWFDAEHQVLSASVTLAAGTGFDARAWHLSWATADYLRRSGRWHELGAMERTGLAAATRLGDLAGEAAIRRRLGGTCALLGDYPQAEEHLTNCIRLYGQLGDRAGQAKAHRDLCLVFEPQGRLADSLGHAEQALSHSQAIGDKTGQVAALSNMGWLHAQLGHYHEARDICRETVAQFRELGSPAGEAALWDSLGYAEHHLGNLPEAATCYERSLALFQETGDRYNQAAVLDHLGDNFHAAGEPRRSQTAWRQALGILDHLGYPDTDALRRKLHASTATA